MRTRHQIIDDLIEATEYHDTEIILNIDHIRDLFSDAIGHLKDASKVVRDNQRLRRHIRQLKADVARLQAKVDKYEGGAEHDTVDL